MTLASFSKTICLFETVKSIGVSKQGEKAKRKIQVTEEAAVAAKHKGIPPPPLLTDTVGQNSIGMTRQLRKISRLLELSHDFKNTNSKEVKKC